MRVLFDHQIFSFRYGGASKYFAMLMNYLPHGSWASTSLFSCNEYVRAKQLFRTYEYRFRGQSPVTDVLNTPYTHYRLRRRDYDIYHQTNFGTSFIGDIGDKPMVTTYHDSNLSTIDPHPEIVEKQRISLQRADAIIAVSNNTKKDLLQLFDVDERKVHVVYHGIEIPDLSLLPQERIADYPYILYVGRRSEYKNFWRLAEAFAHIHHKYPEIHLLCTSEGFSTHEFSRFTRLGIGHVVHHISADEATMLRLYRDATLFVFPSLYEGFGMPILESWSCGCPVALSSASCFPEIAGDAGAFFDPEDVDSIADCIGRLLCDEALLQDYKARGMERVRQFSWQKCADEHMMVYSEILADRGTL